MVEVTTVSFTPNGLDILEETPEDNRQAGRECSINCEMVPGLDFPGNHFEPALTGMDCEVGSQGRSRHWF